MNKAIRILLTTVMLIFVLAGGVGIHQLGLIPNVVYAFALTLILAGGVLWEIWFQPARDEAYRQQVLTEIEEYRLDIDNHTYPTNLQDAREMIKHLTQRLNVVTDAYVELKEQQNDLDDFMAGIENEHR